MKKSQRIREVTALCRGWGGTISTKEHSISSGVEQGSVRSEVAG